MAGVDLQEYDSDTYDAICTAIKTWHAGESLTDRQFDLIARVQIETFGRQLRAPVSTGAVS